LVIDGEGSIIEDFIRLSNEIGIRVRVIGETDTGCTFCASVIEGGTWDNYIFVIAEGAGVFWIFREVVSHMPREIEWECGYGGIFKITRIIYSIVI